jgi:polyisoprenyl-teichoic acid--peptidoglycan teichoic acid transferase
MFGRPRAHAAPTARARRLRAAERERERAASTASPWGLPAGAADVADPEATQRKRKPLRPGRVIGIAVVLVLLITVVGSVLLWQRVNAFNQKVSSAPMASTALFGPLGGISRVNVLMIGYAGEANHGGEYLADSLNIISIDPKTNETTLIPIPRDLWIQGLPEMPRGGKVNEAFADGWDAGGWKEAGRVQTEVISQVTGLTIQHWLAIDFAGLSAVVDAVDGVTVENPRAFSYTWWEDTYHAKRWSGSFPKGTLHLNGTQALTYTRVRYTSVSAESSDFARSVRQEQVLSALRNKLGSGFGTLGPGLAVMDALGAHLKTDLSAFDLFLLSGHMHADRRLELKLGTVLAAGRNSAGSYILFPAAAKTLGDYAPLRRFLATELAKPIPTPKPAASPTTPG